MAEIAALLGEEKDASYYEEIAGKMKKAIQTAVIKEDGTMPSELMGAYVLPLYFDLVPENLLEQFSAHLVKIIEDNEYCLDTGFLGTPFLLDTLCKIGRKDLAYRILWQDKCPSWLFEVDHGATTIWESWYGYNEDGAPGALSFNHYSLGAVDDWMFRYIGGIDTDTPGYKHLIFNPRPNEKFTSCKRTFETVYGTAVCDWKADREQNTFSMDVSVPCNATATVILPDGTKEEIGSGTYHFQI